MRHRAVVEARLQPTTQSMCIPVEHGVDIPALLNTPELARLWN
jgi:hypothetical protein